jgi:hypothetical protein
MIVATDSCADKGRRRIWGGGACTRDFVMTGWLDDQEKVQVTGE